MAFENFKAFHSYLAPFLHDVPLIHGPHFYQRSTHTMTPSWKMFHSYLDPIIMNVPFIPGPPYTPVLLIGNFLCTKCRFLIFSFKSQFWTQLPVDPNLNLEQNRLLNSFFYYSRCWVSMNHFGSTCSESKQSDNKFKVEIRTDLYYSFNLTNSLNIESEILFSETLP